MKQYKKSKRYYYFRKQKLLGAVLLVCAALLAFVVEGGITASLIFAPLGLYIMFTKEMMLLDDYYYEMNQNQFSQEEDL